MQPSLSAARDAVQSASELADDAAIHEQLDSIDEGLDALTGDAAPVDDATEGERLEEIERQLVQLGDDAEGLVEEHLEAARDHIDAVRRERARDWE